MTLLRRIFSQQKNFSQDNSVEINISDELTRLLEIMSTLYIQLGPSTKTSIVEFFNYTSLMCPVEWFVNETYTSISKRVRDDRALQDYLLRVVYAFFAMHSHPEILKTRLAHTQAESLCLSMAPGSTESFLGHELDEALPLYQLRGKILIEESRLIDSATDLKKRLKNMLEENTVLSCLIAASTLGNPAKIFERSK